jgi:hypothetical protein
MRWKMNSEACSETGTAHVITAVDPGSHSASLHASGDVAALPASRCDELIVSSTFPEPRSGIRDPGANGSVLARQRAFAPGPRVAFGARGCGRCSTRSLGPC